MKKYLVLFLLLAPLALVNAAHCPEQYTLQGDICLIKAAPIVPCRFIPETSGLECEHSAYLDLPSSVAPIEDGVIVAPPAPASSTPIIHPRYKFFKLLKFGMRNTEVLELQRRLVLEGLYRGVPTGYFDNLTKKALISYQKKHKLPQTGTLYQKVRNKLNSQ